MKEAYLEIVELDDGEIVLRPASEDGEETSALVTLKISDETKNYLQDRYFELAKCMFHAGIDFVYSDQATFGDDVDAVEAEMADMRPKILH